MSLNIDSLALLHAQSRLHLCLADGPPLTVGEGPAALVSELIRLARIGARAEQAAHAFPHTKVRTVVREALGRRP